MAVRAYFDLDRWQGRTGFEGIAAGAGDHAAAIFGMDVCFHLRCLKSLDQSHQYNHRFSIRQFAGRLCADGYLMKWPPGPGD
jgi:hypothetical protein